jgi:hypothetical protein
MKPPFGGWNSRDNPAEMQPNEAVSLINLIPRPGYVEMRGGYESYATGVGSGDVDLVTEFYDGSTRQLIAASPTNIYNASALGAASSLGSGFTNGRWDVGTMNGIMGFVNGADTPQKWDGTTLSTLSTTGPTANNLIGIHIFKGRSYFWEDESQSFWYSDTNALGGTLTEFALGQIAKQGGRLLRMTSWTHDGGAGPDDYAVFIMDTGEVIVYQGDNPGSALAWGLVGIYQIGRPINDRSIASLGGNIMLVTEGDIVTLPAAFSTVSPPPTKLSNAISDAVYSFGDNPGWEIFSFPNQNLLIINVPVTIAPDTFEQYVIDARTGSPCRFIDLNARTWGLYDGDAYFGGTGDGVVYKYNTTTSDVGSDINCTATTAWTDFGIAEHKSVTMVQPVFEIEGSITVGLAMGYDFEEADAVSQTSSSAGGTPWGSPWGSPWGPATTITKGWSLTNGRGSHTSLNMKFGRQGDKPKWLRTDYLVRKEGSL